MPKILKITEVDYSGDVYNLHVENNHNYLANNIIVSNCHGAKASVISSLINDFGKNIKFRYGVTGTLPTPIIDMQTIKGSLGGVIYEISAAYLIKHGYLSQVEIEPVQIQEVIDEEFPDYMSEKTYLGKNSERLDYIADLIINKVETFGNTLVLVNTVKQGQLLQKRIKDSIFLSGASENELRAEWYGQFNDRNDLVVFATFGIASTGISIDRIFCLVMIDAGKSAIRVIQSVGRSLRKGRDKDRAHVVDIFSKLKWSKKHFSDRKKLYKKADYPLLPIKKAELD